jgi:hypothetical protein
MIGTRIEIEFEAGEPRTVFGENAIGIYLEPEEAMRTSPVVAAGPDSLEALEAADSLDAAAPDSLRARLETDSLAAPPDTVTIPTDTLAANRGRVRSDPDTVRTAAAPTGPQAGPARGRPDESDSRGRFSRPDPARMQRRRW